MNEFIAKHLRHDHLLPFLKALECGQPVMFSLKSGKDVGHKQKSANPRQSGPQTDPKDMDGVATGRECIYGLIHTLEATFRNGRARSKEQRIVVAIEIAPTIVLRKRGKNIERLLSTNMVFSDSRYSLKVRNTTSVLERVKGKALRILCGENERLVLICPPGSADLRDLESFQVEDHERHLDDWCIV